MGHSHKLVEEYTGFIGYGLDRKTDEKTIIYYLQKFSDDDLISLIIKRLSNDELLDIFELISRLLKKHLNEEEYHSLFLKESDG